MRNSCGVYIRGRVRNILINSTVNMEVVSPWAVVDGSQWPWKLKVGGNLEVAEVLQTAVFSGLQG